MKYRQIPTLNEKQIRQFYKKIDKNGSNGCWIWTASISGRYGQFNLNGSMYRAHRISYELAVGTIPEDMDIDHLCENTHCVRPEHLEAVTQKENCRRYIANHPEKFSGKPRKQYQRKRSYSDYERNRTHCPQGHLLDSHNIYTHQGRRRCKRCSSDRAYALYHTNLAKYGKGKIPLHKEVA